VVTTGTGARRYFFYSPEGQLLAETELTSGPAPAIAHEYIWFAGRPVAQVEASGATFWTVADHLGTPLLQTNATGTIVWRAEYEPYGRVFSLRTPDRHQPLRLPGQEAEQLELGANGATERFYNVFRWYRFGWSRYTQLDPLGFALHRFISEYPIGLLAGDPNFYTAREKDNTGMYYYRERYYYVELQRFVSEDPIGVWDGENLYLYVGGNPLSE
jgi:RHS repeat-associated protein